MNQEELKKIIPDFPEVVRNRVYSQLSLRYIFKTHITERGQSINFPANVNMGYYLHPEGHSKDIQNGEWSYHPKIEIKEVNKRDHFYLDLIFSKVNKKISDSLLLSATSEEDMRRKLYEELLKVGDKVVEMEEQYLIELLTPAAIEIEYDNNISLGDHINQAYDIIDQRSSGRLDTLLVSSQVERMLRKEKLISSNTPPRRHNLGIVEGLNAHWVSGIPRHEFFIIDSKNAGIFLEGEFTSDFVERNKPESSQIMYNRYFIRFFRDIGAQYIQAMWPFSAIAFKDYGIIKFALPKELPLKKPQITPQIISENVSLSIPKCFIKSGKKDRCDRVLNGNNNLVFIISSSDKEFNKEITHISTHLKENHNIEGYFASEDINSNQDIICERICSNIIESRFCIVILNPPFHRKFLTELKKSNKALDIDLQKFIKENSRVHNPNVYWEYGIAKALNKKCILFCREDIQPAWDIDKISYIPYRLPKKRVTKISLSKAFDQAINDCVRETQ